MPICFYIRCKPQAADAIDLVRSINRVFLGYPALKKGYYDSFRRDNIRECMYDLSVDCPTEFDVDRFGVKYGRQVSANRNLIRDVNAQPGSLALVPRPESGLCFVGKVEYFELVDRPNWIDEYKSLRECQSKRIRTANEDVWSDDRNHIGDVVQTFALSGLKALPFFAIPGWIRYQLFGRATAGRVSAQLPSHDPYTILSQAYESGARGVDLTPTNDPASVENRLLNFVTPGVFEHLVCELLQLERKGEYWWHVGGPGDGGVDGLGFDHTGATIGAVQCKLTSHPPASLLGLGRDMRAALPSSNTLNIFVCSLYSDFDTEREGDVTAWGRKAIVRLLLRHGRESTFGKMIGLAVQ